MLVQVDKLEAHSRTQAQKLQREWDQRLEAAIAELKAEEQTKMYMQEVRIEQLTQRLAAVEATGGDGNLRPTTNDGSSSVSEERVAALITSVELLRGQISDLETQLSVVTARRNARNGALGLNEADFPVEVDKRLRDVERGQQQSLLHMEERLAVQTDAAVERCALCSLPHDQLYRALFPLTSAWTAFLCSWQGSQPGHIENAGARDEIREGSEYESGFPKSACSRHQL